MFWVGLSSLEFDMSVFVLLEPFISCVKIVKVSGFGCRA